MSHSIQSLREDAMAIWHAGVAAVDSQALVRRQIKLDGDRLMIANQEIPLLPGSRLVVVGAGKAGAGMAAGFEDALGDAWLDKLDVQGWVNVPADCVKELSRIRLHPARPAGVNEPTQAGVEGTRQILQAVSELQAFDTCVCLLSGGGSALLPAPVPGISLADKKRVTQALSAAGANIEQMNTVRKQLSLVKGGKLAQQNTAGCLITLVISDVLGDPLDVIASGPTVPNSSRARDALAVLEQLDLPEDAIPLAVWEHLEQSNRSDGESYSGDYGIHHVIGNNQTAVEAAAAEATRRGWKVESEANTQLEGTAEEVGRRLAGLLDDDAEVNRCFISGGEPVVALAAEDRRGKGGRNQQLVLAAIEQRLASGRDFQAGLILSAGTDGEDGPTDAAGAWIDEEMFRQAKEIGLDALDFLQRNDAYSFLDTLDGLVRTGPTHTNVCDLRIVLRPASKIA